MRLTWSARALADIEALKAFSRDRWGDERTADYLDALDGAAERVALDVKRARPVATRFRKLRVQSHNLVFEVLPKQGVVVVVRVLHTAMDLARHL